MKFLSNNNKFLFKLKKIKSFEFFEIQEITIFQNKVFPRDIYDSKNHPVLDGFQDQVSLPIDQMFHCLKGKVDDVLKIKPFIDAMKNDNDYEIKCTGSDENRNSLKKIVNYYMPNTYQDIP